MKRFLIKSILFFIPIPIFLLSGLVLPPTPRVSKSLIFANKKKDSLLLHTKKPRIIFVGGSNLSFGLNSFKVKELLNLNPINTAVQQSLGIKYMLENTLQYIKRGDIIVLAFEYEHFYRSYDYASETLLRTIFDVRPHNIKLLTLKQGRNLLQYIPKFTFSKFKPSEYWGFKEDDLHSTSSFNKFGDVDAHWSLEPPGYQPREIKGNLNNHVLEKIKEFENIAKYKGATVYVTFPSLDEITFSNSKNKVLLVEKYLNNFDFKILGSAEKYIMPQEMMFNTYYHLNKNGLENRTKLFIEDFKKARTHNTLYK